MSYCAEYLLLEPSRATVDALAGPVVMEFGAPWCGHCRSAQPALRSWLADVAGVTHLKIEDGKGRPLGRSFGVTLWPTLIVLDSGQEHARAVRPVSVRDLAAIQAALDALLSTAS